MITQRQLHALGQDFRDWLLAHKDEFPPLKIVDVRYEVDRLLDETIIRLVVRWNPAGRGPSRGFCLDAFDRIVRAVNDRQSELEPPVQLYVAMKVTGNNEEFENAEDRDAFHAVFHRLTRSVSQSVAPDGADQQTRYELCRVWQHGDFNQVCGWISNAKKPSNSGLRGLVAVAQRSPELVRVAKNFQLLMDARHDADYDHLTVFRRLDAVGVADVAEQTLCDLDRIRCDDPAWRAFVTLALLRTKVA